MSELTAAVTSLCISNEGAILVSDGPVAEALLTLGLMSLSHMSTPWSPQDSRRCPNSTPLSSVIFGS